MGERYEKVDQSKTEAELERLRRILQIWKKNRRDPQRKEIEILEQIHKQFLKILRLHWVPRKIDLLN